MPYQQLTRAQLRGFVQNRLGAGLGTTFFRTDELNRIIQEALRVFNACTGYWKTRVVLTTVANQVWYSVSSITNQLRVSFNDSPMSPTSFPDADNGRVNWESETTATGGDVPTFPTLYIIAGINLIGIWPADALGNNSLVVDGIADTPILTIDGSFVDIGQEEVQHLLDYCELMARFKQGGSTLSEATPLLQAFLKGAAERNGMLTASARFRQAMGIDTGDESKPRKKREAVRLGAT